jgi:hypothetical protein
MLFLGLIGEFWVKIMIEIVIAMEKENDKN